jgi:hypothetical protein
MYNLDVIPLRLPRMAFEGVTSRLKAEIEAQACKNVAQLVSQYVARRARPIHAQPRLDGPWPQNSGLIWDRRRPFSARTAPRVVGLLTEMGPSRCQLSIGGVATRNQP